MSDEKACLNCGQTPSEIKRDQTICGIEEGYEYKELAYEWPRHRWADWTDKELGRMGIVPAAFDKHRRTSVTSLQWVGCADTVRGHSFVEKPDPEFGIKAGQCFACGQLCPVVSTSKDGEENE